MAIEQATAEATAAPPARERRPSPRALRLRILGCLVAVAVVAATMYLWPDKRQAPPGFFGGAAHADGRQREIEPMHGRGEWVFQYIPRAPFSIGLSLSNPGPRPIRVLGFPQQGPHPYFKALGVKTGTGKHPGERHGGGASSEMVPFSPFTLAPGESRYVVFHYRFAECVLPRVQNDKPAVFGGGVGWQKERVRYRVGGATREAEFELPHGVALEGAMGDCPFPAQ